MHITESRIKIKYFNLIDPDWICLRLFNGYVYHDYHDYHDWHDFIVLCFFNFKDKCNRLFLKDAYYRRLTVFNFLLNQLILKSTITILRRKFKISSMLVRKIRTRVLETRMILIWWLLSVRHCFIINFGYYSRNLISHKIGLNSEKC